MESSIYYVALEGLKQIHSFFPPEENSTALANLIKVIEELEQMLQNKSFSNFKSFLKPFYEFIGLILKHFQSTPSDSQLDPARILLFDKLERTILRAFHLIFLQSSPGNYPDYKSTSFIILILSNLFTAIAIRKERPIKEQISNNQKPTIYETESLEFLLAQVCHACLNSIPGALYVHGKMIKRLFELLYRSFSLTNDNETHDKIRAIIEDIILLLFNRYNEPDPTPEIDSTENSEQILSKQITENIMRNTSIIKHFLEPLLANRYYKIRIISVDIFLLIRDLCNSMQSIDLGYHSMAYAAHFLIFVLNTKSTFFETKVFTYALNKYLPAALTFAMLNIHEYFTEPTVKLLLTIYHQYSTHFTGNFEIVLADGLLTALKSPNKHALIKGITTFSKLITSELHFWPNIFTNLDCNKYYSNIFQRLTEIVADQTYPAQIYRKECIGIVHNLLEMMKEFIDQMPRLKLHHKDKLNIKSTEHLNRNDNLYELAIFNQYSLEMTGVKIFNGSPQKGVFYFLQNKIIKEDKAKDIADFLFNCEKLDKYQIALFLTEPANGEYLSEFIKNYSFLTANNFDGALRIFMNHIGLPRNKDRAKILIDEFGKLYQAARRISEFRSAQSVSAFTMKLLSYQGYEQRYELLKETFCYVSKENQKCESYSLSELCMPPLEEFIEQMKGINDGTDLSNAFLKLVHFNISTAPIILSPFDSQEASRKIPKNGVNTTPKTLKKTNQAPKNNEDTPEKKRHHSISHSSPKEKFADDDNSAHLNSPRKLKKRKKKRKISSSVDLNDELQTNLDQNEEAHVSQFEINTSLRIASSLSFPTNKKDDKAFEWYLCKCNQIALLIMNLPVHQEEFYHCKSAYVIKPMFDSIWGSIHGPIVANIESATEDDEINEHLDNLNLCISISARNGSSEALTILMSSLITFTGLQNPLFSSPDSNQQNPKKMTHKNVLCFKRLLNIAMNESNFLAPAWSIFVDELSLVDLNKPKELLTEDNDVLDQINDFFTQSSKFEFDSFVSFVNAMIKTCDKEIQVPNRRFYMLEKLILVAQYNMKRPTNEWNLIWDIIGNNYLTRLIQRGDQCHDFDLSKMIISHLRYLSSRYLLLDELPDETNQYNFLMTFLNVFQDQNNEKSKMYLLECLNSLIQETSPSIKSGWIMVFHILTIATSESFTQDIAFKILTQLVTNKIVLDNPRYLIHLIAFIATYSINSKSAAAIHFFPKICDCMLLNFDKSDNIKLLRRAWIELFHSIGRSSQTLKSDVRRQVQDVYLKCLVQLAEKVEVSAEKDSPKFQTVMNDIWSNCLSSTFETMWFCELDKFLSLFDERFIQKYSYLLGANIKHVIRILIHSLFKGRNDEITGKKKSKHNVDEVCLVSIHILLNLVSSDIDPSTNEFVINLLEETICDIPNLSIEHGRSYVYLMNQFAKQFGKSNNDFIDLFTLLSNTMLTSPNTESVKRNVICALARESLFDSVLLCDSSIMSDEDKAKVLDETLQIYQNSGFTQSPESEAGKEWSRVICQSLHVVNSFNSNDCFNIYFKIISVNLFKLIESSSKEIRTELGLAIERKLL